MPPPEASRSETRSQYRVRHHSEFRATVVMVSTSEDAKRKDARTPGGAKIGPAAKKPLQRHLVRSEAAHLSNSKDEDIDSRKHETLSPCLATEPRLGLHAE